MISAQNHLQLSSGNNLRDIYLISKTPYSGVKHIPILTIKYLYPTIDFSLFDGIIFTSKNGVDSVREAIKNYTHLQALCVGEPTARAVRELGFSDIYIADGYGKTMPSVMIENALSGRWLYIRAKVVASNWADDARALGLDIDEAITYKSGCNDDLESIDISLDGVLVFTSPSSIECFLKRFEILDTHTIIAIGTTTQKALPSGVKSLICDEPTIKSAISLAQSIS